MFDLFSNSVKSIFRKKGRNVLTVIGISIGIASVTIIGNISDIGTCTVSKELDSLGLSGLTVSSKDTLENMTEEELEVIRECNSVAKATPIVVSTGEVKAAAVNSEAILWGIDHSAGSIISLDLMYGRFINQEDIKNYSKVCLVDKEFAERSYSRDNIVGKKLAITSDNSSDYYTVVGIIKTGSGLLQTAMGSYIPNFIYVPYSTLQVDIGMSGFHQVAVKVNEGVSVDIAGKAIIDRLEHFSGKSNGYVSQNLAKQKQALFNIMDVVTIILTSIGAVALLVAGLNIMTVMLVSVSERTKEIGIKKALGASDSSILCEFIFEAMLLCLFGACVGSMFGVIALLVGTSLIGIDFVFNMNTALYAVIFSLLAGVIFGVYPAKKAAKLNPVTALRYE